MQNRTATTPAAVQTAPNWGKRRPISTAGAGHVGLYQRGPLVEVAVQHAGLPAGILAALVQLDPEQAIALADQLSAAGTAALEAQRDSYVGHHRDAIDDRLRELAGR